MYAAFNAWKDKFKANIMDMGGKLESYDRAVSGIARQPYTALSREDGIHVP